MKKNEVQKPIKKTKHLGRYVNTVGHIAHRRTVEINTSLFSEIIHDVEEAYYRLGGLLKPDEMTPAEKIECDVVLLALSMTLRRLADNYLRNLNCAPPDLDRLPHEPHYVTQLKGEVK